LPIFDVASGVLWEQVDVKVMLIDSASSELVTLNPVGSLIWQALAKAPATADALARVVVEAFPELGIAQAEADVESFVGELVELGFVSASA
jgi:hypothetical protein